MLEKRKELEIKLSEMNEENKRIEKNLT